MRSPRLNDERGVALAMAIFALVIIGILVAGSFFAGRLEQQSGQNTLFAAQAAEAAEAGLSSALVPGTFTSTSLQAIAIGGHTATTTTSLGSGISYDLRVDRLTDGLFLYKVVGNRLSAGTTVATRSVGTLVQLLQANIPMNAGLTALGNVKLSGNAEVTGIDAVPPLWVDPSISCPALANTAGVRYNLGTVTGANQAEGYPPVVLDATLTAAKMKNDFDQLKGLATLVLTDGNPAATVPAYTGNPSKCDTSKQTNWGEPTVKTDPCFNYFPVIYYKGDLKLQGDRGQGILLVEGDLTITGSMVFYGPVYITGTLSAAGNNKGGSKFYGGVVAGNVLIDDINKLSGNATVDYSSCAIKRALKGSAVPTQLNERSWVQLYN